MSTRRGVRSPGLVPYPLPGPVSGAGALAYPNMALVKYWSKRDETLNLPVTDSISMILDILPTTTQVTVSRDMTADTFLLDGHPVLGTPLDRVRSFLELVRGMGGRTERAVVESVNTVPTAAGLASSAAGFAALAAAAAAAYGLRPDSRALSRLARRGSGSACRSIFDGFAVWHAGHGDGKTGDESSYAEPLDGTALAAALVLTVVQAGTKTVPSREAMRHTADTSPLYRCWASVSVGDAGRMHAAIASGDLDAVGQTAEGNALGMHGAILAARPAIGLLSPSSMAVLERIWSLRAGGITAYATIDAGPHVAVLCHRVDAARVAAVGAVHGVRAFHIAHPGPGARVVEGGGYLLHHRARSVPRSGAFRPRTLESRHRQPHSPRGVHTIRCRRAHVYCRQVRRHRGDPRPRHDHCSLATAYHASPGPPPRIVGGAAPTPTSNANHVTSEASTLNSAVAAHRPDRYERSPEMKSIAQLWVDLTADVCPAVADPRHNRVPPLPGEPSTQRLRSRTHVRRPALCSVSGDQKTSMTRLSRSHAASVVPDTLPWTGATPLTGKCERGLW
ncbi:diphosphomevalonate decarboxylase [Nocardia terpenica]|uniref:Diphosphomevalonate decarboxylase n=1 Tax=Nocardia terpenica TaxID=455432 RepID=A0A6G9ZDG8_9NOCA|nr:diphosphomevalonate decarboxylase [Nocardia terpenica]